ncbi:hypothetical protein B9Z55_004318 [Caenorhabditis nigoni]|nr:hypothetical protein B9Z55_004318 [Caenorhabditis nigoni]
MYTNRFIMNKLATTSEHIGTHWTTSEHIELHRTSSEHIGTHRNTSEHIGTFGKFGKLGTFGKFGTLGRHRTHIGRHRKTQNIRSTSEHSEHLGTILRMENAVEAEAKFLEAKQKLEKQGTDFVKKKIGSALISNKQVILEDFDGEPENWDAFYETFKPIVEENAELLDVVKFALLKKSCKGKAGDMIRMYNSADYFKEAVDRLKKVYDDKDNRFRMLWDRLENVRTARETVSSMRATINDVAAIVSALKKVNQVKQNQKNVTSQSESVTNLPFESPAEVNTSRSNESPPEVNESLGVPVEPGVINRTNQSPTNQQLMEELFYTRRRDFTHFLWSPGVS